MQGPVGSGSMDGNGIDQAASVIEKNQIAEVHLIHQLYQKLYGLDRNLQQQQKELDAIRQQLLGSGAHQHPIVQELFQQIYVSKQVNQQSQELRKIRTELQTKLEIIQMKWSSSLRELFHYGLSRSDCDLSETGITRTPSCFSKFTQSDSIGYELFVQSQFSSDQEICGGSNISFPQVLSNVTVNCDQPTNLEQGPIYHSAEKQQSFPSTTDYHSNSSEVSQFSSHTFCSMYLPRSQDQHPFLLQPSSTCDPQELSQLPVGYLLDDSSQSPDSLFTHSSLYTGEFASNC
ncbi:uncharacterized protein LOC143230152 isoform X2 [Tachypleus tridentatus]|uniref:uncharacterized protein LOC143230152 isoform X2 n=1 Tax=Tachypleus tridentatus TaxID=6853 RepID=UPI003FD13C63